MKDTLRVAELLQSHPGARIFQAPGRVNLLGEHTDYSGGFCLPAALTFNTLVAATPRTDSLLILRSLNFNTTAQFDLRALPPKGQGDWTAYPAGVAWALQQQGITLSGADLTLSGNVPLGAGLSSSASVEVATATALLALGRANLSKADVALVCQRAENLYVGANCGIMDQFISAHGVRGNSLALDTRDLTFELAPIPAHLALVVANSMVRHSVAGGQYAARRREVEEAAAALGVPLLREASLAELESSRSHMSDEAFHRARHVISDSHRVLDGLAALRAGNVNRFGELMTEAHASYRDDFAASCAECDALVKIALSLPGCLGSRLTGGGFGGCTVSLVELDQADSFAAALKSAYQQETSIVADVFLCNTADGAGELLI